MSDKPIESAVAIPQPSAEHTPLNLHPEVSEAGVKIHDESPNLTPFEDTHQDYKPQHVGPTVDTNSVSGNQVTIPEPEKTPENIASKEHSNYAHTTEAYKQAKVEQALKPKEENIFSKILKKIQGKEK